jgi:DNA-binding NarL/FixJ family response regulator
VARIRVLIADDHAVLRDGVRALLDLSPDIEVVGEAADGQEAIERCRALDPDVALLDVAMPGLGGLEAALTIGRDNPRTRVVVLTQYADREYVTRFLKAGVAGYVLKRSAGAELVAAVRAAASGGLVLDPAVARDALEAPEGVAGDPYDSLTPREKQVLKLVAEGKANKEIADTLGIGLRTAMSHREHLMAKLGAKGRTELIRFAIRRGVIPA